MYLGLNDTSKSNQDKTFRDSQSAYGNASEAKEKINEGVVITLSENEGMNKKDHLSLKSVSSECNESTKKQKLDIHKSNNIYHFHTLNDICNIQIKILIMNSINKRNHKIC